MVWMYNELEKVNKGRELVLDPCDDGFAAGRSCMLLPNPDLSVGAKKIGSVFDSCWLMSWRGLQRISGVKSWASKVTKRCKTLLRWMCCL